MFSTQDNAKLLQQSGFKTTMKWSKYQSKVTIQAPNPYLDYLIDPSFQGLHRSLSFKSIIDRTANRKRYLPIVEIKDYDVMIGGKTFSIND